MAAVCIKTRSTNSQTDVPRVRPWLWILNMMVQALLCIPGILCIQASKFASLGGQQILDCDLNFPGGRPVTYMLDWKKEGLRDSVLVKYDGYAANVHESYSGRARLVKEISLEISHIQESDEGWYECKVIYIDGTDNREANGTWIYLNVYIPPKIISSSPQSFHKPLNSTARIYCNAGGFPKPQASWTKDERPLVISQRVTLQSDGSEVIIRNLQKDDGGIYKCTFNNSVGAIANTVHLIVEGQAYIIGHPSNKTAVLGQRVQFICEARGYPANITYRWYKDGRNVNLLQGYGSRIVIQNDGSLVITIVEKVDMGWYQCRPSNGVGQDPEAVAFLNVTYKPTVLLDQMTRSVIWALDFQERLDCPVDANPPVYDTVWTKNGIVIDHQSDPRLMLLGNGSLLVHRVSTADSGNYRCTAMSTFGTGDSQIIQVEVKDPPRFLVRPDAQYFGQLGEAVVLPCVATGTPTPTIVWRKESSPLDLGARVVNNGGNLTIYSLVKTDHGIYECEAQNPVRIIVTSTEIIIQNTTPYAPYNVTVETDLFTAKLRWLPAYSSTPQYFIIWFRSIINSYPGTWTTMPVEPKDATRFTIYSLEPDTNYEFKVLAKNEKGDGQFSESVLAKTLGERPTSPANVTVVHDKDGLIVTWNQPAKTPVTIFQYSVEYNSGGGWTRSDLIKAPGTKFVLSPIEPGLTYSFRVLSHGLLAYSIPSDVVSIQVPKDEDFGLSKTVIGGIVGGLLFLLVAITLTVLGVVCTRRKDKKRKTQQHKQYGNVKYSGTNDETDGKPEYTPEWSEPPPYRGGGYPLANQNAYPLANQNASPYGLDNGVFMLPQSADPYSSLRSRDKLFPKRDSDRYLHRYNDEQGPSGAYQPDRSEEYVNNRSNADFVNNFDRNSTINSGRHLVPYDYNDDTIRSRGSRSTARNRSRSQPAWRHSDGPSYPVPRRPRSRGQSLPRDSLLPDSSFQDDITRYGPQPQKPARVPQQPTSQTPVQEQRSFPSYQSNSFPSQQNSVDDVFMPPLHPARNHPSLPRHSSMKPGSQQTYLTDDLDTSGHPFMAQDISSVLPSPYQPYQRQYPEPQYENVPYDSRSRLYPRPDNSRESTYDDNDNTVVARNQSAPDTTLTQSDRDQSDGYPFSYTRDHLLGAVDQVRRAKGSYRGAQDAQIPESVKPTVIVRDRPSKSYSNQFPYQQYSGVNNRNSINSSGTGSLQGQGSARRDRPSVREDLTPDSVSSGIGSRNTSSQLTGSSLHSRPSRLGSSLAPNEQNLSRDSGAHTSGNSPPYRKDISGDENYEFDSYNAVETDLLEALRNYSEVHNGNEDLLSALQEGLSATGLMSELYPKPSRQSRYSDSEQRFEKLRGEFHKYRQRQRDETHDPRAQGYLSYLQPSDSYSSTRSSRHSGLPEPLTRGHQYYSPHQGNGSYKHGPMDSDML
ncbi:protein turtle-like isoform X2 [Dreissena polymorpha]|uniref:protein turtle-like isoform X2 n=1 Tax=Dreissena polymorpha TaxID=45954 RepID=UPI002264BFC8|nr:protein turtle-like isoform X2 [Dreissena polymorpha]